MSKGVSAAMNRAAWRTADSARYETTRSQADVPQRWAPEHERDWEQQQHHLEAALLEHVEIGRLPLGDEALLDAGELRLDDVAVKVDAVGSDDRRDGARDEHKHQVPRAAPVDATVNSAHPVHRLDEGCDANRNQAEDKPAVEIGPCDHHQREPVDRARATAQVAVEPQQLEAGEREGDHLGARSPDRRAGQPRDADHERGDHQVGVLEPDPPPDEQETDERHRAERD